MIAAESGSGKSFLTNELIFPTCPRAQVWVIDAGKSYQKLSEMLNGDFVHFEEGTHVCLNPFELIQNYEDEEDAIVSLVCAMASAKGLLDEWQISALKQVLSRLWEEKGKEMKVDDIAERCWKKKMTSASRILVSSSTPLRRRAATEILLSQEQRQLQNQFTVLELDELQGRKHLRQVVLLQLIYQIQQEVFPGERNRKKVVIVDEARTCSKRARSRSSWNMPTANSVSTVAPLSLQRSPSTTSMRTQWAAPSRRTRPACTCSAKPKKPWNLLNVAVV